MALLVGGLKDIKVVSNRSSGCAPLLRWGYEPYGLLKQLFTLRHDPYWPTYVGNYGGVPVYTVRFLDWDNEKQESRPMDGIGLDIGVARDDAGTMFMYPREKQEFVGKTLPDEHYAKFSYRTYAYCDPEWFAKVNRWALADALAKAVVKAKAEREAQA